MRYDDVVAGLETVVLKQMHLTAQQAADMGLLFEAVKHGRLSVAVDHMTKQLFMRLQTMIATEQLGAVKYPSDWWQAFKERWLPDWAKKRWPVRYTTVEVHAYYPNVSLPEEVHFVRPHLAHSDWR